MLRQSVLRPLALSARTTALRPLAPAAHLRVLSTLPSRAIAASPSFKPSEKRPSILAAKELTDLRSTFAVVKRGVADSQSTHPASKDFQHATTNARAQAVIKDFAEIIAGRSARASGLGAREDAHHQGSVADDFTSITKGFFQQIPAPVFNVGLLGGVPYIGTAVGCVFLAREAGLASRGLDNLTGMDIDTALASLHTLEHVQITYGAIILSFLGALHWGMEFSKYGGEFGYQRLALGVVPVLLAWPTTFLTHGVALAAQWASFTGMWMMDQRASIAGWTPEWYSTYRFYLSILVGFSIIFTMAGTNYFGVDTSAQRTHIPGSKKSEAAKMTSMQRLDLVGTKKNAPGVSGKLKGSVGGGVAVEDLADEGSGDGYGKIVNKEKEEEEEAKEEEEKQKKSEKQDEKDVKQAAKSPEGMKASPEEVKASQKDAKKDDKTDKKEEKSDKKDEKEEEPKDDKTEKKDEKKK